MSIFKNLCVADDEEVQEFIKRIAANVKRIRLEKGVTQLALALMIGQKSAAFYANAENSAKDRRFNLEHLYKIAKALDVDVTEFFK
ncbi:MAG: helix-turn-helix transcriptional regulator [Sulfuricurvum sp.]|uniref:helix-turn-helix domain-containing protein n=2 Tax=Sulfuricurvum sp. TaxID=2025608 RepID=UPI002614EA4F|nr:helix-turn-helix transcriptional regulator [uncultured Sulfuricurvum sp.]MDD2839060.1 helix-turn-helix transcriptional regulator [Sulfuricurvum sp.]